MTPNDEVDLQSVADTIFRPRGEEDEGAENDTNPGRSLELNPNPRSGVKSWHPDAACARNVG